MNILKKIMRDEGGRPPLYGEATVQVSVTMPVSLAEVIDRKRGYESRSRFIVEWLARTAVNDTAFVPGWVQADLDESVALYIDEHPYEDVGEAHALILEGYVETGCIGTIA